MGKNNSLRARWNALSNKRQDIIKGVAVFLTILIISFFCNDSGFDFMCRVVIMMLFASSLNIILGFGGQRPLGHAAFFGIGAYAYVVLNIRLHWSLPLAIVGSIAITLLASYLIGVFVLRSNDDLAFAFMSMGINILLFTMAYKMPYVGSDTGLAGNVRLAFATSTRANFYLAFLVTTVCIILIYLFFHSPFASVLKGSRENPERLTFLGIRTHDIRLVAFVVSGFFACIAGILYAMRCMGAFTVMLSTNTAMDGVIMCLIGGMYSFFGPILGAVIEVAIVTELSIFTKYYQGVLGVIIVLCVLFLQGGLLHDRTARDLNDDQPRKKKAGAKK